MPRNRRSLQRHRVPVVILFLIGLVVTLLLVSLLSSMAVNHVWLDFLFVVLFGFFLSGPTCLIGLIGAEQSDRRTVATATGLLGYISYLGAAMAGFPVTLAVRTFGWISYFLMMIFSSFLSVAFLLPLSKAKSKRSRAYCGEQQNDESLYEIDGTVS
ncbi:Probable hexose phosphate transport protein [Galdieria sulphuraria]|nr:Probable hexose phosphate transport protein [Galdieria sulphuraria]